MMSFLSKLANIFRVSRNPASLVKAFDQRKGVFEEQFFQAAAIAGTPRGLRWVHCEWLPERALMKDKVTGQFVLLVGVNISFEAVEGGDMEGVAAVSMVRDACAVFQWQDGTWQASGRALFNMSPADAAPRLGASYELV